MNKLFTLLFCLLFVYATGFGQSKNTGTITGKLTDSVSHQNLKDATVSLLDIADSSLITYALSKADGSFSVENIPFGSHLLQVSFQGYKPVERAINVNAANSTHNLGSIFLAPLPKDLGTVVVKTTPVTIKGDTTEFNANQFKTKPNASAEDLLKKLPGVEVDKDGTVKSQGQNVTRVLVDGKRFFGDDPKMATRNLPTDVIDKIQVIDAQSDQSAFSGFDDGNREKVVNIITKKDKRKGMFGRGTVAAGDKGLYSNNISINKFNGDQKISIVGQANNVNSQNFGAQDFLGAMGGGNRGGGGGRGGGGISTASSNGISRTLAGGLNYNDNWSTKTTANGSYFYNNVRNSNNSDRYRETFVPKDSSLFNTNSNISRFTNQNHRFNFEIEQKFDTSNSLLIRPTYSYQENDNNNQTNTYTTRGKLTGLSNVTSSVNSSSHGYNFNDMMLFRHRFKKRGRTISLNLTQALNSNDRSSYSLSYSRTGRGVDTIDQVSNTNREGKTYGANLSYTEPAGAHGQFELNYNYNYNQNNSDQKTFRLNSTTKQYDNIVDNLTNVFENTNISHRVSANYRRQISKFMFYTVGLGVQHADLTSNNISKNRFLSQSFNNLFPTFSLQYMEGRTKNLRFSYRGSTNQPSISQLQDVIDNTNILHHTTGNAALKQEFSNNFNLSYTNFNVSTFRNFLVSLSGGVVTNKISNYNILNSTTRTVYLPAENDSLQPGGQFTKPINLSGGFNVSGFINYGFPIKSPKSNLNFTTRLSFNRDVTLSKTIDSTNLKGEDVKSFTNNYTLGETVRWTMNLNERFDLNFFSTSTYNFVRYSVQKNLNADYFSQAFSAEPTYTTKSGWVLATDFDYTMYRGQSSGYNQAIPLLNASISKMMMKDRRGELKLSVFDLLNQNKSITRTVTENYIEDVRTQVLTRYVLLSFTYNLRRFKGSGGEPQNRMMNMFRGPGGMGQGQGQGGFRGRD